MDFPKLVTGRQMAEIDRRSTGESGVTGAELMERAGARVVETLRHRWGGLEGLRVAVVCGKGNNGGDGFAVARLLRQGGVAVDPYLAVAREDVSGDAALHLQRLEQLQGPVAGFPANPVAGARCLAGADVVVDALLGTGLVGAPREPLARVIGAINAAGRPVVAVDLPSGVEADSGRVHGACVKAAVTVTFGLPKVGQLFHPGRAACGALELVDIGFPAAAVEACPATSRLLTACGVGALLPRRPADAHKGSCGAVVVVAGSVGMTGAAALCAESALRSGAGRVTLGTPASLNDILEAKLTEVMTRPLPEVRRRRCLSLRALGDVVALVDGAQAMALGPGIGRYRETVALVRRLLARQDLPPTVVDADGLNALVGDPDLLRRERTFPLVLTPHLGEFQRLSGRTVVEIADDPLGIAAAFAGQFGVTLILKGSPSIVATSDGATFVNPTGNAGMATAGTGDVLAGLVAGLLAQGLGPVAAAAAAAYAHGAAGDRAREDLGEWGMTAGDVASRIPKALMESAEAAGVTARHDPS